MDQSDAMQVMIERARRQEKIDHDSSDYDFERMHRVGYLRAIEVVGEYRHLAWGTMIYACTGSRKDFPSHKTKGCGFEHRVWMCVGVEGPPALRDLDCTIPSPFYCGTCPDCGSPLAHDRWNEDEEWEELRELPLEPDCPAYFVVPTEKRAKKNAKNSYGGAEFVDPTGQTKVSTVRSA